MPKSHFTVPLRNRLTARIRDNSQVFSRIARRMTALCLLGFLLFANALAQNLVNLNFKGHYRSGPKTSIVRDPQTKEILIPNKTYSDLGILLNELVSDADMLSRYPALKSKSHYPNQREPEEQKNVEVLGWIHAVKFEGGPKGDQDFHVILGNSPDLNTSRFMTIEVSGLPKTGKDRATLKEMRQKLLDLFPNQTFTDRFTRINPAKKVRIKGSLFFDGDHFKGARPGPSYSKPKTLWEIHPVYSIQPVN